MGSPAREWAKDQSKPRPPRVEGDAAAAHNSSQPGPPDRKGTMDASDSPQRISNLDFERFRLRRFLEELAAAGKGEIVEVPSKAAPVQQVVLTGDQIDVTALPVHLQHGQDGGPYISASVDFAVDAQTGLVNSGLRRLMLRGKRETGVDLNAPSDLRAIYIAAQTRGETLPVSFVVGAHPIDHVAATMRVPGDELELVAKLRDAPLPVVKCVTNDIRVPADAEFVIEGYLDARGYVEDEGPYGEYLGYYGGMKLNPVFHVTAITRRRDAVFQTLTI